MAELHRVLKSMPFPGEGIADEVYDDAGNDGNQLIRCIATSMRIRKCAEEVLHDPKDFHYALGLFICSVQQLQYEDANLRAMLALADCAINRLEADWGFIDESNAASTNGVLRTEA